MSEKGPSFYTDGKGYWLRRDWAEQCDEKVWFLGHCQGVKGHQGNHWCYSPSGDYLYSEPDGGCGSTPPGNNGYMHPIDMQEHCYRSRYTDTEVVDEKELARLNAGNFRPGEAMHGPVDWDNMTEEKKRIKAYECDG